MRVLLRILAALFGLGLAAVGALLTVEVVWTWLRPAHDPLLVPWHHWREYLQELAWHSTSVRVIAGTLVAGGLLLLLIAATAHRRDVHLRDPTPDTSVIISPKSLARIVGQRVRTQDNVTAASVTATPTRIRVRAVSRLESEAQLQPRLLKVAKSTMDDLPLVRQPRVSVIISSPRNRRR